MKANACYGLRGDIRLLSTDYLPCKSADRSRRPTANALVRGITSQAHTRQRAPADRRHIAYTHWSRYYSPIIKPGEARGALPLAQRRRRTLHRDIEALARNVAGQDRHAKHYRVVDDHTQTFYRLFSTPWCRAPIKGCPVSTHGETPHISSSPSPPTFPRLIIMSVAWLSGRTSVLGRRVNQPGQLSLASLRGR